MSTMERTRAKTTNIFLLEKIVQGVIQHKSAQDILAALINALREKLVITTIMKPLTETNVCMLMNVMAYLCSRSTKTPITNSVFHPTSAWKRMDTYLTIGIIISV